MAIEGLHYDPDFLSPVDREELLRWLSALHPIWEDRFPARVVLRSGQQHRRLLRPVYWLGYWQFACLDYYRPPTGIQDRCVHAEPFPPVLAKLITQIERTARSMYRDPDMPEGWALNSCLINFYGLRMKAQKWVDTARVGAHRDFEPGPVASLSLGEPALFQFVDSPDRREGEGILTEQWLEDGSMQIFGGKRWKEDAYHRVQQVGRRGGYHFEFPLEGFRTRRVNFTFRYVPEEHGVRLAALSLQAQQDIEAYVQTLAQHSPFFAEELATKNRLGAGQL